MSVADPVQPNPERRFRFSLRALLGLVTFCAVIFSGLAYLRQISGEQGSRENLDRVSKALMDCVSATGRLPSAYVMDSSGRRMHSWRSCVVPLLDWDYGATGIRYKFDEPWDGPQNTLLRKMYSHYFLSPFYADGPRNATYLCVVGGALWPVPRIRDESWKDVTSRSTKEGGVLPGRGKAIVLVEVAESSIPWTKPEDISLSEIAALLREDPSGNQFRRRIRHVVAVDATGTPFILKPRKDMDEIKTLVESEASNEPRRP